MLFVFSLICRLGLQPIAGGLFLNTKVYQDRMRLVLRPFFADADDRAQKAKKQAYTHIVGLGLGVWQLDRSQQQLFVDAVGQVLYEGRFQHIGVADFSYFDVTTCGGVAHDQQIHSVQIKFSRRYLILLFAERA